MQVCPMHSIAHVKINANNYLLNAKEFDYMRYAKHAVVAHEKYHCCLKS
jgi:hypothetical protein